MDEYPNSDEEFELMYGDELELIREQEDLSEPPNKSKRSLDFSSHPAQNVSQQSQNESPSIVPQSQTQANSSFDTDITPMDADITQAETVAIENVVENSNAQKRTIEELFGDIDDILSEPLVPQVAKKQKTVDNTADLALINHIIELRKLAKEKQNPLAFSNRDNVFSESSGTNNITFDEPKYSSVAVTRHDGKRIYVRCHSAQYEKEEVLKIAKNSSFVGVMGNTFQEVWKEAKILINMRLDQEKIASQRELSNTQPHDVSILKPSAVDSSQLWVDLYKPRKYYELLSDESTNRILLQWLKLWDKVVFNRKPKQKPTKAEDSTTFNKFQKKELNTKLDEHGRPEQKVALLCGPPGLGKTTLAHIVAKHAGYNVVEINASDERNIDTFKTMLENATQMRSVLDKENRPNCLVFDEIDGAPPSSIEYLIKFINGTAGPKKKKGKGAPNVLKRPIICICNDVYVPALRPLRQISFIVNFPPTASARLAERLNEIARHQRVKADLTALLALCEKSNNDIRSCLSVLHFFKSLSKPITLTDVYKTSVGQKDIQKGLFAVWQDIFQIERPKTKFLPAEGTDTAENPLYGDVNLKTRMRKVLSTVTSFGDYERVAQGVFENYPTINARNTSFVGTCKAMEWFCFTDIINKQVYASQSYTLQSYVQYAFVIWHFAFASFARPKITYPSVGYEVKVKTNRQKALVAEILRGMQPYVRSFVDSNALKLDILPILSQIIVPSFRPVNLHLYTQQERQQLNHVVSVMIDYNLNYVQERTPQGSYVYNIDPNIDDIIHFSDSKPKRVISYSNKQTISHEIEVEKIRRLEKCKLGNAKNAENVNKKKGETSKEEKQLPNHLQRLQPKVLKPRAETVTKDFFGRVVTKSTGKDTGPQFKQDIWFKYKEGFTNAVRMKIKIANLK